MTVKLARCLDKRRWISYADTCETHTIENILVIASKTNILCCGLVGVLTLPCLGAEPSVDNLEALNAHNMIRDRLNTGAYPSQPVPDPPLPPMIWSQPLTESALAYAHQCTWQHSTERINTGENLFASTALSSSISKAVDLWADEVQHYSFETSSCEQDQQCGHYTQIAWQSSILVGCAAAICDPLRHPDGSTLFDSAIMTVCHYGPAGNLIGAQPYDTDGGDASLRPTYFNDTGNLNLPYMLVRHPDNLVTPYEATLTLVGSEPSLTFELRDLFRIDYEARNHITSYDVASTRLYLPHVDAVTSGNSGTYTAVLENMTGSQPFRFRLIAVR